MLKNAIIIKKVRIVSFIVFFSLVGKAQIDPYAKYSENAELLLNLPTLTTISSTSLVVNCEYTPKLIQGWASDKVIDAMGVIWSTDSQEISQIFETCPFPYNSISTIDCSYIKSMKNLNVMHKIPTGNPYDHRWYDTHEGLFEEGTNKKFTMSVAPSRGISFVIGDNGAVCIDAVNNPTNTKTFRSDVLKPGTKYYIRAFVLYHPGGGWASLYNCIYSPIQTFTTANVNPIDNNYLFFPRKKLVCSGATIDPINGTQVTGGTGTYNYSWQSSSGSGVWTPISGATGMSYTPVYPAGITVPEKTWYRRIVSSAGTPVGTSTSSPVNYVFVPASYSCDPVYDADSNPYLAATIGAQTWLTENLNTTRFSDNTSIQNFATSSSWTSSNGAAYSQNLAANEGIAANLYSWYVVNGPKKACPTGYHVSTLSDWNTLIASSGRTNAALNLKSASYWQSDTQPGKDSNPFYATPDGYRMANGNYNNLGIQGAWWVNDDVVTNIAIVRNKTNVDTETGNSKNLGLSIRCVKNQ